MSLVVGLTLVAALWVAVHGQVSTLIPVVTVKPWATSSGQISNAVDNSLDTSWGSAACRSGGWRSYEALNPLMNQCSTGACSGSCAADLSSATDGSPYTAGSAGLKEEVGLLFHSQMEDHELFTAFTFAEHGP